MNSDSESEGSSSSSCIGDNDVSREINVRIGENNSSDVELTENMQECADAITHKTCGDVCDVQEKVPTEK